MNWLKKGPELKLPKLKKPSLKRGGGEDGSKGPSIKPPAFLADLYYDLRDRRLLPLVALVVVAIAAVPFLLGGDVEQPALPAAGAAALESSSEETSKLTVVEATPGLRDYRKRLKRQPTDPFKQLYTESAGGSASSSSAGEASSSGSSSGGFSEESVTTESSTITVEEDPGDGSSGGGSSNGSGSNGSPPGDGQTDGVRLFEFVLDVQISHTKKTADGGQKMSDPEVRHQVKALTQLPAKVPVVTSMGVNLHTGKVVWLVSNEDKSLDGDFDCVARTPTGTCELLEIEPGFPLELTYGPDEVLYRIKVTKIDTVWAGKAGDQRSSRASFAWPASAPPAR
jgi:hypothetical protein